MHMALTNPVLSARRAFQTKNATGGAERRSREARPGGAGPCSGPEGTTRDLPKPHGGPDRTKVGGHGGPGNPAGTSCQAQRHHPAFCLGRHPHVHWDSDLPQFRPGPCRSVMSASPKTQVPLSAPTGDCSEDSTFAGGPSGVPRVYQLDCLPRQGRTLLSGH